MVVQYQTYFRRNEFSSSIASPEQDLQLLLPILHCRRHATQSRHLEVFLSLSGCGLLQSAVLHSYTTHLQLQHPFCKLVASILSTTQGVYFISFGYCTAAAADSCMHGTAWRVFGHTARPQELQHNSCLELAQTCSSHQVSHHDAVLRLQSSRGSNFTPKAQLMLS